MRTSCNFCRGKGCIACAGERARIEKEMMKPLFVAKTPEDLQLLKDAIGREALEKAFRPDPGRSYISGVQEIEQNLAIASLLQYFREHRQIEPTEPTEPTEGKTEHEDHQGDR